MLKTVALLSLLVVALGGCAPPRFAALQRNVEAIDALATAWGHVHGEAAARAVVVALRRDGEQWRVENYARSVPAGRYVLRLTAGRPYRLAAFDDRDGDLQLDADEAAVFLPGTLTLVGGRGTGGLDFDFARDAPATPEQRRPFEALPALARRDLPIAVGARATLDDPAFGPEAGQKGLWAPADFLGELGGGIYLLEDHDPARTPVLFVHGAGGHPSEFRRFVEALDRTRYQAWVYQYPSGARLDAVARLLASLLDELARERDVRRLVITAHSMGGLVSRAALQQLADKGRGALVPLFVSLATPWRGHEAAELGARFAPTAIPSWLDMQTDADFQQRLFAQPLPPATRFELFFGYHGRSGDGTVSLASQLRREAQRDAARVAGFDETHTSILQSDEVLREWVARLAAVPR